MDLDGHRNGYFSVTQELNGAMAAFNESVARKSAGVIASPFGKRPDFTDLSRRER